MKYHSNNAFFSIFFQLNSHHTRYTQKGLGHWNRGKTQLMLFDVQGDTCLHLEHYGAKSSEF